LGYHGYHFGLYSHTQKSSENCVYALAATGKRQVAPEHLLQTSSNFVKSVIHGCVQVGANGPE